MLPAPGRLSPASIISSEDLPQPLEPTCNLQTGDLLGSGTVLGPTDESRACLAELTARGSVPLQLPNGETKAWLLDGHEVIFRARAERDGFVRIGFNGCRGVVQPAVTWPQS